MKVTLVNYTLNPALTILSSARPLAVQLILEELLRKLSSKPRDFSYTAP